MLKAASIGFLMLYLTVWLRFLCPYLEDGINENDMTEAIPAVQDTPELECLDISYLEFPSEDITDNNDVRHPNIPTGLSVKEVIAIMEESIISIIRLDISSKESDFMQNEDFLSEFLFAPPEPPPKA